MTALKALLTDARAIGLDALVEVHDETELGRALTAGADLIGVNNRNLRTLAVDIDASRRLARLLPAARDRRRRKRAEDAGRFARAAGSRLRRVPRGRTADDGTRPGVRRYGTERIGAGRASARQAVAAGGRAEAECRGAVDLGASDATRSRSGVRGNAVDGENADDDVHPFA